MDTLRLASHGLSKHDQEILSKQLKMLRGRTACEWVLVDDYRSADVTLVQGQPPSDMPGIIALASTKAGKSGRYHLIEWPIRLFGLIDLLMAIELEWPARAATPLPTLSLAHRLARIRQDQWLDVAGMVAQAFQAKDEFRTTVSSFDELIERLASIDGASVRFVEGHHPLADQEAALEPYSLKAVIWSLALREEAIKSRQWHISQQQFGIATWPLFGTWETAPWMLRLAALYGRQPATLADGVELTGLRVELVAAFLHACELCELGLTVKQSTRPPRIESKLPAPESLLARLRRKLGLGYKRT
ncbi:hypothetical protein ACFQDN_07975 [Pseudomonas asuensis]|uniref:Uncharacterized protein n=1 Tax=Pseudomonas asuensis TaxID=1825787 RepID=A0ABQ2GWJ6_9PSED|nr:hypothetical protein [Pseudomonas asuensis]GGM15239.1 hypothetical protein GCM10009425_27670 [Pseudomonas asuensis]